MAVRRWTFVDFVPRPPEKWTVPLNPDAMTSPFPTRKFTYNSTTAGPVGTSVTFEGHPDPVSWQFSGQCLDQAHFDALLHWSQKPGRIYINDHYNRTWLVQLAQFNPIPKRAYNKPWRHTYTMTAIVYPYDPSLLAHVLDGVL